MDVYARLKELGLELPQIPKPGGVYAPVKEFGDGFVYMSGVGPTVNGAPACTGRVGKDIGIEKAQEMAVLTTLNLLSILHDRLGDLNRIVKIVKMLAFVASADNFFDQPKVLNASTGLLVEIFGDEIGKPARSAIGVNVLPGNIPVEIELLLQIAE